MPTGIYPHKSLSEITKRKISQAHKGKILSETTKRKLSQIEKGRHNSSKTEFKKGHIPWSKGKKGHVAWNKGIKWLSRRGKGSNLWKGGKMADYPEIIRIRKSIEYRLWREAIFARDNWVCQKCKKQGVKLHSHHIKNFIDFPELRLAIDNGITLCKECHQNFHKKYGKKNNTKEQLEEFLCQK